MAKPKEDRSLPDPTLLPWKCESCGKVVRMPELGDVVKMHEHVKGCNGTLIRPPLGEKELNRALPEKKPEEPAG